MLIRLKLCCSDCMYGDKASWCDGIQADDCYNPSFETTCCRTCAAFKTSNKGTLFFYENSIQKVYSFIDFSRI